MDDPIIDCMKKLTLFHTPTFKPIMTHDELDPIMVRLGFMGRTRPPSSDSGGVAWREYMYGPCGTTGLVNGGGMMVSVSESLEEERRRWSEMRWPRLPWPRIDGCHVWTYRVFLEDVKVFLERDDLSTIFHVRGMPLHRAHDRHKRFKRMGSEESFYVYSEETLDCRTLEYCTD
ncbi:hypothetical protein Droror1_Dr00005822 [Drosera rotundifolia]